MNHLTRQVRGLAAFLHSRIFAIGLLAVVLAFVVGEITTRTNAVYVVANGERTLVYTTEDEAEVLLEKYAPTDEAQTELAEVSGQFTQINVSTPLVVSVIADGRATPVAVPNGATVGEVLYDQGIRYDANDLLNLSPERAVEHGDQIQLQRVEYEEYTIQDPIPFETVRKSSPLLRVGLTQEVQEGKEGQQVRTYIQRTVDGKEEEVQLLGQHITSRPVSQTVLIGSVQPVSPLDFNLEVDANGKPLHYQKLMPNQIATGYSARPGAKTASGMYAVTGHVAVNPNVIPYGSKLYITSADGSFIYGCAVAADTGTGLMAGIINVDLFYDTYTESAMNGRKYLDIYVLE